MLDRLISSTTPQTTQPTLVATIQDTTLTQGQLLRATVQRVADSLAWLTVRGQTLVARADNVALQPQQRVMLQVAEVKADQVTLRLADLPATAKLQPSAPAPTFSSGSVANQTALIAQLTTLLTEWGVEADEINLAAAKALLVHQQSITPNDIQTVRSLWRALPQAQLADLEAVTFLQARQLPVNPESVTLARHFIEYAPQLARQLTDLQAALSQLQTQLNQAQGPALKPLAETIQAALGQMANWALPADAPAAELAARLPTLMSQLNTPPETNLAQTAMRQGVAEPGQAPVQRSDQAPVQASAQALPQSPLQPEGQLVERPEVGPAPQAADREPNPLPRLLTAVRTALADPNLDETLARPLRQLAEKLDTASNNLSAFQLNNLGQPPTATLESYYLFPIPLHLPDGPQTAQLKIFHRPHQQTIDPDNVRLALLLDLPELGEIAVNLTVFEQRLSGQILTGLEDTRQRAEANLDQLRDSLADLGYRVEVLSADRLPPRETAITEPVSTQSLRLTQINLSA